VVNTRKLLVRLIKAGAFTKARLRTSVICEGLGLMRGCVAFAPYRPGGHRFLGACPPVTGCNSLGTGVCTWIA
jgi:hypothetical protein